MGCVAAGTTSASNCAMCLAGTYSTAAGDMIVSLMYNCSDCTHRSQLGLSNYFAGSLRAASMFLV
jgi:hypothetical protein